MAETLRDKIIKRPLCACCAAFSAGITAGFFVSGNRTAGFVFSSVAASILVAAAVFSGISAAKRREAKRLIPAVAALVSLAVSFGLCRLTVSNGIPDISAVCSGTNDHITVAAEGGTVFTDVSTGSWSAARNAVSLGLSDVCRTNVDVLIYTHLHTLHVSSFDRFSDTYLLSTVLIPEDADPDVAARIEKIASEKGIKCVIYGTEPFSAGNVTFDFSEPAEIRNRVHDAICFTVSSEDGAAAFCSAGYLGMLPENRPEKLFILSHGNQPPGGPAPEGAVAMSRETALECGAGAFVSDGKSPASFAFRLDE